MCLLHPVIPPPWLGTTDLKYRTHMDLSEEVSEQ